MVGEWLGSGISGLSISQVPRSFPLFSWDILKLCLSSLCRDLGGPANTTGGKAKTSALGRPGSLDVTCLPGPLSSDDPSCSASAGPPPPGPRRGKGKGQRKSNGCVFYPTPDFYAFQRLQVPVPKVERLSLAWPEEEAEEDSDSDSAGSWDMGERPGCFLGLCHLVPGLARCLRPKSPSLLSVFSEDGHFEEVIETPGDSLLGSPRISPPLSGPDAPTPLQERAPLRKRAKRALKQLCCLC